MNKLNKIFLSIIIILIIALGTVTYFCIKNLNTTLSSNETLYLTVKAVNDAGFSILANEDGSFRLVERTNIE